MRIAVIIIGLCLGIGVAAQSFFLASAASFVGNDGMSSASSSGIIAALMLVIGAAFAYSLPRVSIGFFALAALIAYQAGATSQFHDLKVWGWVAAGLAVMSFFGHRELRGPNSRPSGTDLPDIVAGSLPQRPDVSTGGGGSGDAFKTPVFGHYQQPPRQEPPMSSNVAKPATSQSSNNDVNAPVPPVAQPPIVKASVIDQIERLATLRTSGAIDETEYQSLKTQLLGAERS